LKADFPLNYQRKQSFGPTVTTLSRACGKEEIRTLSGIGLKPLSSPVKVVARPREPAYPGFRSVGLSADAPVSKARRP
jgi:hypothetical protein